MNDDSISPARQELEAAERALASGELREAARLLKALLQEGREISTLAFAQANLLAARTAIYELSSSSCRAALARAREAIAVLRSAQSGEPAPARTKRRGTSAHASDPGPAALELESTVIEALLLVQEADYIVAEPIVERARQMVAGSAAGIDPELRSEAYLSSAMVAEGLGAIADADGAIERALEEAAFARSAGWRCDCFAWRAGVALALGRFRDARNDIDAALIAVGAGTSALVAASVRIRLGGLLLRLGALGEALACISNHLDIARRTPRLALQLAVLEAEIAMTRGDLALARTGVEEARERARQDPSARRMLFALEIAWADLAASRGEPRAAIAGFERASELSANRAPRDEVSAWLRRSTLAVEFLELEQAESALAGALKRARAIEDRQAQAVALGIAAEIEVRRGRLPAAASTLREGIALCELIGDAAASAALYRRHAEIALEMGDLKAAEAGYQGALEAAAESGLVNLEANVLLARGSFRERRGNYITALSDYRAALKLLREQGNSAADWAVWLAIGSLTVDRLRKLRRGRVILESVDQRAAQSGQLALAAEARARLAAHRAQLGDVDMSYDLLSYNVDIFRESDDKRRLVESLLRLADLFLATLGSIEYGRERFNELALILEESGDTMELARCHRELGFRCSQLLEGRFEEQLFGVARAHFESGLEITRKMGMALLRIELLLDLGDLLLIRHNSEDIEEARAVLEQARKLAAEANHAAGLARYESSRARLAAAREVFREALQHFEIARQRYEAIGDMAGVFRVERSRAEIHMLAGERNRAELSLKRALAVAEKMGSLWEQRMTYHALHMLKSQLGDYPAAAQLAAKSRELDDAGVMRRFAEGKLRLYRRLKIKTGVHEALLDQIATYLDDENRANAREIIEQLQVSCAGDPAEQTMAFRQLGDIFADRGDLAEADSWYFQAFEAVRSSSGVAAAVELAESIAGTLDDLQDASGVDRWLDRALETAADSSRDLGLVRLYGRAGDYYKGRGRYEEALEHLKDGLQCAREIPDETGEFEIAWALGELHRELSRFREAVAWFEIADRVLSAGDPSERHRDLALRIASCHALAAAMSEDERASDHEVEVLRRQARSWLTEAVDRDMQFGAIASEVDSFVEPAIVSIWRPNGAFSGRRGEAFEPLTPVERRAHTTSTIGEIYFDLRDEEAARRQFEEGAKLLERSGFPGRHGDYLATVGDRFREHEVWGTAAAWYRRAFFAYLSAGEPERALEVAADIGAVYLDARDPEMAVNFCQEAAQRLGADVDADILGRLTHLRARLERRSKDPEAALSSLREAVGYLQAAGDIDRVVEVYDDIALVLRRAGEEQRAIDSYRELLELVGAQEDPQLVSMIHSRIGAVYRESGDFEEALRWFNAGMEVVRESGNEYALAGAMEDIALTHLDSENMQLALETFGKVLEIYHRLEDLREIAWAHLWCCDIYLRMGDTVAARKRARLAENIFRSQRMTPALIEAAIWVAQCENADGNEDAALEGLEYALGRTKVLPRDEDKIRPARFLFEIFSDLGQEELAQDCARLLERLGEDVDLDSRDEGEGDDLDEPYPDEQYPPF